jgi:SAM-dependent methyltransferase
VDDPATFYTHAFVRDSLPPGARRLLEVGCGEGALAAALQAEGFALVALDTDAACVKAARARGVDARLASWPDFDGGRFDAVLFTRSLHHVGDLEAGVAAAFGCLGPGGRIIVEDFDFGYADEATLGWFASLLRLIQATRADLGDDGLVRALAAGEEAPLAAWRAQHHHDLHPAEAIEAALRASAASLTVESSAYFFRYLARATADAAIAGAMLAHELDLIGSGRIAPLGRRYVAAAA